MNRTLLLATAVLIGGADLASACSWMEMLPPYMNTILTRKQNNALTVHGVLIKKETGTACGQDNLLLHLEVEKVFGSSARKGDTLILATNSNEAACGVDYPVGTELVVFANGSSTCDVPAGRSWTYLMNKNIVAPSQSQIDSLYGLPPVASAGGPGGSPAAVPPSIAGWLAGGTVTFPSRKGRTEGRCRVDGTVAEAGRQLP